jgi:hypothetical protein
VQRGPILVHTAHGSTIRQADADAALNAERGRRDFV